MYSESLIDTALKRLGLRQQEPQIADPKRLEALMAEDTSGACGITAVQSAMGATREVVDILIRAVCDNENRSGKIKEKKGPDTGDGAGISLRTDNDDQGNGMQEFLHAQVGRKVPATKLHEQIHGAHFFIDTNQRANVDEIGRQVRAILGGQGLQPLSWKEVVTDPGTVSARARQIMPLIYRLTYGEGQVASSELERAVFNARLRIKDEIPGTHSASLQPGILTWKGMLRGQDLARFYPDLKDPSVISDGGTAHTRFGTNVLAHWRLAQPFGLIAHNGEVNSILVILEGLRQLERSNGLQGSNIMPGGSDSANFDRVIQMLHDRAGLSLPEAVRFLMHPAPDDRARMAPDVRIFFRGVSRVFGPLKGVGPIALLGMDRNHITATLDGMGLRPLRYVRRNDGLTVIGSEVGSPHIDAARIVEYGRVGPGESITIDRDGTVFAPGEADRRMISESTLNVGAFADAKISALSLEDADQARVSGTKERRAVDPQTRMRRENLFGLTRERLLNLSGAIAFRKDPVEGMGSDLAIPALSKERHSLAAYMRPNYSQVTNPALDPERNKKVFSLETILGRKPKQRELAYTYEAQDQYRLADPLLDGQQLLALLAQTKVTTISTVFSRRGDEDFKNKLSEVKDRVLRAAQHRDHTTIVLSDREVTGQGDGYIPPHLLVSYLRKALVDQGLNEHVSLVVDSGEVVSQHEYAMLLSCGADAVHPRMIYEMIDEKQLKVKGAEPEEMRKNLREAFNFTLLRYMSKLGITELDSYRGGRSFSTLGLDTSFVNFYFGEIPTNGSGYGLEHILENQAKRADEGGDSLRGDDETHAYAKSVRYALEGVGESSSGTPEAAYATYLGNLKAQGPISFRDLLRFKSTNGGGRAIKSLPLESVMPKEEIIREVLRGASMSLGALNETSHNAIHLLFNKYESRASSGEGGVSPDTKVGKKWEAAVNKVRQIASGRFAADAEYIADPRVEVIEIKIGQGAKPGVGGHLPGEKVSELVAEIRGVGLGQELISPPTNHNIYSIEDLEAFISHLRALNPAAKISVKITSGANVGNIAVGCVKAGTDMVQVSGDPGGTAAATFTDRFHTGLPTETGVAEVDRALVQRGLRDEVVVGADGGIRTGEDVLKLIMLGADEVALGTALLIAQQKCIFCANCPKQTCPSGITRSDSTFLTSKKGKDPIAYPEDEQMDRLMAAGSHFLELMAEEIRAYMAKLGVRDIKELRGRRDLLEVDPQQEHLAKNFEMGRFLETPTPIFRPDVEKPHRVKNLITRARKAAERVLHPTHHDPRHVDFYLNHPAVNAANRKIISEVEDRDPLADKVEINLVLTTQDRSVGATLAGLKVKDVVTYPKQGVVINSTGEAGQGYAYGLSHGVTMNHRGVVQNEVAEIQSAGTLVVMPPSDSPLADKNDLALVGNTLAYGARGGDRFIQASIGDRGCERHTGGRTVISGNVGKYFAEYMTGGRAVVLKNFWGEVGTGMSGGTIYGRDKDLATKLSADVMVTGVMRQRDLALLHEDLKEFHAATGDAETAEILENWDTAQHEFRKVVARGQYATGVFQYLMAKVNGKEMEPAQKEHLAADLFEMCGFDVDVSTGAFSVNDMENALEEGLQQLQAELSPVVVKIGKTSTVGPEQVFIATKSFAGKLIEKIKEKFEAPQGPKLASA